MSKLTFFPVKGAAEIIRYILAYGEEEFEDQRINMGDWPKLKNKTPLGVMPVLTLENGKQYHQSLSIARYFAEKFDIAGKTAEEKLHADMVAEVIRIDMNPLFRKIFFAAEGEEKEGSRKEVQMKIDELLSNLEKSYVDGEDTFLASGLSWADIVLYNFLEDGCLLIGITFDEEKLPKLNNIRNRVKKEPKIAKWIAQRPVTDL